MKIRKYLFRDHYKVSKDKLRNVLGLYHDYKDQLLTDTSNPIKGIYQHSIFEISDPVVVDEDIGLYKQNITFKPARTNENSLYLNTKYDERTIEELESNLVPRVLDLEEGGNGFIYPATPQPDTNVRTPSESNSDSDTPPDYNSPLETVEPPPFTNRDAIITTINSNRHYEDINTIVDEVTELKASTSDAYINAEARYNFHIPQYEQQIQSELIPEEVLPNFYVVSLALNQDILNSISQEDYNSSLALGNTSPYENLYKKFDRFITLDGNLSLNRNANIGFFFALALVAYMKQYAEVYDSVSVDYIETVKKRFGHLFNNLTNREILDKLNEFKSSYPMYINLEWTTTTLSPLLVFLQNAGISLQALQTFLGEKLVIRIQSTGLAEESRFSILAQSPRLNLDTGIGNFEEYSQTLYTYDAGQWILDFLLEIFSGTSNDIIHPNELFVIDQNEQQIPITDQFDPTRGAIDIFEILNAISAIPGYRDLLNTSMRTYKQIINGDFATSEVLLYKIEKRNSQHVLLQTFYIPNVSGIDVQNYVDTQVKYNKEYKYKIFAYTAIYGTEYYYSRFQYENEDNYYYRAGEGHLTVDTRINLALETAPTKPKEDSLSREVTITGWFRVHSADEGHQLFDTFINTSAAGPDKYVLGFFGDNGGIQVDNLLLGKWYHLAIVCRQPRELKGSGSIRELYIDTRYAGLVRGNPITNLNGKNFIPGYAPAPNDPLFDPFGSFGLYSTVTRDISNIAVFTRALNNSEVKTIRDLGRCWDIRKAKKGVAALGILEWPGETPALYWRKKAVNDIVTNDGYAGEANLVLNGDATSIKCDENALPNSEQPAEASPPLNPIEPRDILPPLFDVDPIYGEIDQDLTPLDPYTIPEPFKGEVSIQAEVSVPYEEPGVPGYGEVFIPPEEPPYIPPGEQQAPPNSEQQAPPNSEQQAPPNSEQQAPPVYEQPPGETKGPNISNIKVEVPTIPTSPPNVTIINPPIIPIGVVSNPPPRPPKSESAPSNNRIPPNKSKNRVSITRDGPTPTINEPGKVDLPPSVKESPPTVKVIPNVPPPTPAIPVKVRVTKERVSPTTPTQTTPTQPGTVISVGGGSLPPLPPPKKTIFKKDIQTVTVIPDKKIITDPEQTLPTTVQKEKSLPSPLRKPPTKGKTK